MSLVNQDQVRAEYARLRPTLAVGAAKLQDLIGALMDDSSINYLSVHGRAKTVDSFAKKASKLLDGSPKYLDPLSQITDQLAVRIITYLPEAVETSCELLRQHFKVREEMDKGAESADRGVLGYASKHFLLQLGEDRTELPEYSSVKDRLFEVQVRTTLQHAWAEFEHDIRYKIEVPPDVKPRLDRRFALAAGLIELADNEFSAIHGELQALSREQSPVTHEGRPGTAPLNAESLTNYLTSRYTQASRSKAAHYEWMSKLLKELGIRTTSDLDNILSGVSTERLRVAMNHKFTPGAIRQLDDELLASFGERYIGLPGNRDRETVLRARLEALDSAGISRSQ